ncbi:septal ring lytic transglycosylase RlpA family protein [Hyphobacterium sp. HN65]|uniref:Endolytic peptidoglycan transglycosylase RlpA n=1 Tax=Hyphobacterium lacteum TaxID=3116575 RepID=A0ABU7LM39_9PROT|nr:septal ring lytic transglycosylase RlpA family protein [Hyphobacterium sp. HN65]MEE2524957.1 septal ring lytic transglycosylase RlpA family protein [Hyphobacterium sp. HN65]
MIAALACSALLGACSSPSAYIVRGIDTSSPVTTRSTSSSSAWSGGSGEQKIGRPYTINGRTYVPARDDDYDEVGISSWYGPNFHGRQTANGELFDQNLMTAAHPTLPIPAMIEVTNLENGRTAVLRLNDRGPFAHDRILDVSRAAAVELGFLEQGTTQVRVRYLGPPDGVAPAGTVADSQIRTVSQSNGRFRVQVGAFSRRENAEALRRRVADEGYAEIQTVNVNGRRIFRVFVGDDMTRSEADRMSRRLSRYGVHDATVVALN